MAFTLVINPGSSSKKYALYENGRRVLAAHIEHDEQGFTISLTVNGVSKETHAVQQDQFDTSLLSFLEEAVAFSVLKTVTDITRIAVRVVAPGTYFADHHVVTDAYMKKLEAVAMLAPVHIPHVLRELSLLRRALPEMKILAVSDSAFHQTKPSVARQFSLSPAIAKEYDLYRFGYHGLSLQAVVTQLQAAGTIPRRVIVCHIGSGVSVSAVLEGRSIDTTMGYAPGSGLLMGSRAGDLDTGALLALMTARNWSPLDAGLYIQKNGGLQGLAKESDLRVLLNRRSKGDVEATAAIEQYVYGIQKAVGSYVAVLGGLDMVVFTATAGERSPLLRSLICSGLHTFGIDLDSEKNDATVARAGEINTSHAAVKLLVMPTDEAQQIWQIAETYKPAAG